MTRTIFKGRSILGYFAFKLSQHLPYVDQSSETTCLESTFKSLKRNQTDMRTTIQ